MIAPLQPYALRGVIWYQGEANCGRAEAMKGRLEGCLLGTCITGVTGESGGRTDGAGHQQVSTIGHRFLHHGL